MAALAVACGAESGADAPSFEVRADARFVANDAPVATFEAWGETVHFALPTFELPSELLLVTAYVYRPDAELDLSLVSIFFEDQDDPRRWLLLKFNDRAAFPLLADTSSPIDLDGVAARGVLYVNGTGEEWHDLVFEACGIGVAVKGRADIWARAELETIARSIAHGCDA